MLQEILHKITAIYHKDPQAVRIDVVHRAPAVIGQLVDISNNFKVYGGTG